MPASHENPGRPCWSARRGARPLIDVVILPIPAADVYLPPPAHGTRASRRTHAAAVAVAIPPVRPDSLAAPSSRMVAPMPAPTALASTMAPQAAHPWCLHHVGCLAGAKRAPKSSRSPQRVKNATAAEAMIRPPSPQKGRFAALAPVSGAFSRPGGLELPSIDTRSCGFSSAVRRNMTAIRPTRWGYATRSCRGGASHGCLHAASRSLPVTIVVGGTANRRNENGRIECARFSNATAKNHLHGQYLSWPR